MKHNDDFMVIMFGSLGGCLDYLTTTNPNYPASLWQATLTALVCGAAGYLGKMIVVMIINIFKPKNNEDTDSADF